MMVRQTAAMSAWASFMTPHVLGDVAVAVWSVLYRWVFWRWSWHQVGKRVAGPVPMACVACGRRGEGQACGVVLGCWPCAAVGEFMA